MTESSYEKIRAILFGKFSRHIDAEIDVMKGHCIKTDHHSVRCIRKNNNLFFHWFKNSQTKSWHIQFLTFYCKQLSWCLFRFGIHSRWEKINFIRKRETERNFLRLSWVKLLNGCEWWEWNFTQRGAANVCATRYWASLKHMHAK